MGPGRRGDGVDEEAGGGDDDHHDDWAPP